MSIFIEVYAGQRGKLGRFFAKIFKGIYTFIVARRVFLGFFCAVLASASQQQPQQQTAPPKPPDKQVVQEPPEEDEGLKPKEYALNPLQSDKELTVGNFYFKKGDFRAAQRRFLEATRWNPASGEAFLKLGEANEKLHDLAAARQAYEQYLKITPEAKNADSIRKKIEKWPQPKGGKS